MIEIDSIWIFVMHSLLFPRHACALIIMITSGIIGFPFHYAIRFHFVAFAAPLLIFDFFDAERIHFLGMLSLCVPVGCLLLALPWKPFLWISNLIYLRIFSFPKQQFFEINCHFCRRHTHTHTHNACTICGRKCRKITTVASFEYKIRLWICIENHPILIWCSRFVSCSRFLSLLAGEQKKKADPYEKHACVCVIHEEAVEAIAKFWKTISATHIHLYFPIFPHEKQSKMWTFPRAHLCKLVWISILQIYYYMWQ